MMHKLAFVAIALCASATASAQDQQPPQQQQTPDQLDEAARLTFESARQAFVNGEYERALGLFRQAYQLSNRPGLLYNIAQTLDRLRRDAEALEAFRQFLAAQPDTPNRGEVEARIRVLEQAVANNQPSEDPVTGTPRTGGGGIAVLHPGIFLAAAGLTLVGGGVLIWAGLEAIALNDAYLLDDDPATVQASYDAAVAQELLANVFIGVTAGLAAVSAVLVIFTDWNAFSGGASASVETARVEPQLMVGPNGAFLGLNTFF